MEKFIRLPHSSGQALQRDVDSRDALTVEKLLFITSENSERDPEEYADPVDEENIPYAEKRL